MKLFHLIREAARNNISIEFIAQEPVYPRNPAGRFIEVKISYKKNSMEHNSTAKYTREAFFQLDEEVLTEAISDQYERLLKIL